MAEPRVEGATTNNVSSPRHEPPTTTPTTAQKDSRHTEAQRVAMGEIACLVREIERVVTAPYVPSLQVL